MPDEFFKLDVHFADHPKVIGLPEPAVVLWVASIAYANRHMTDGLVPRPVIPRLWPLADPHAAVAELVKTRLWHEVDGGYEIHDFLDHNRSRAERQAQREAARRGNRERQQRHRDRQRDAWPKPDRDPPARNARDDGVTTGGVTPSGNGAVTGRRGEESREEESTPPASPATVDSQGGAPHRPTPPPVSHPSDARPGPGQPQASNEPDPSLTVVEHPDAHRLCELLADLIHANTGERPRVGKRWIDAARLMLTRDDYTPEQVEYLVRWCQADEFWRSNILSMPKLREKRLTLIGQAKRSRNGHARGTDDADRKRASVLRLLEEA